MGYCTNYTLTVSDRHNEIAEWLDNNESQFWEASEAFQQYGEPRKWYEHDTDMITISKVFPDVLFTLHGEGEESGDIWCSYYKNGKTQYCPAQIAYEEYDERKLK